MQNVDPQAMKQIEDALKWLVRRRPIVQAVIAVERGDRSFCWTGAHGVAESGAPASPDTPFFIASIDKLLNATIALMLHEAGRLDLDAPIQIWLPGELVRGIHRRGDRDYSDQISVRHLLTHTSGLPDWLEERPRSGASVIESILEAGDRPFSLAEIADRVRMLTPHFPPAGASDDAVRARYSDTNYVLLAAIIEAVAGAPLHEVHEEMLYRPLGMRHTWFPGHSAPLEPAPAALTLRADGVPLHVPRLIASFNGIYSTAADLLAFLRALVGGEIYRHAETLALQQGGWLRFGFPRDRAALRAPGWPIQYGMGMMRFQLPRVFTPLASIPAVVGHTGSTGCWLFYCPDRDLFLAGAVDEVSAGAAPFRFVPRVLHLLRGMDHTR
ncbi:MAG: beta-lactamase family protein [Candidatus Hydrogenedentes bacterium]|nr:beta-lactamase family protein [Candidatus Hydrogenedentota bacterium]